MNLKYRIEAAALKLLFSGFSRMPLDMASYIGGRLARTIGPFLSAHKVARRNLDMIYPEMKKAEKQNILDQMWDNLGRNAGELPHLPGNKLFNRVTLLGKENILQDKPCIFFSGHLGNWELTYPVGTIHNVPVTLIYREANNPYVEKIIRDLRATRSHDLIPKGPKNSFKLLRALKKSQSMAMLVDQKMNDGISAPFFGRPAMTASALAEFALRFDLPIVPARVIRKKGAHFDLKVYPALQVPRTGDHDTDVLAIMTTVNKTLEMWIRQHPEQWFWVHRRWPKQ